MVSAYAAATSQVTPRATRLLREDTTTQNVLATFIGSFLFSLAGIVVLSTGLYGEQGRIVLFVFTVGVIFLIVVTLLRWIEHLSMFGRVDDTTGRVERAASEALRNWAELPCLGGRLLADPSSDVPDNAQPLCPRVIGYVQHIDIGVLQAWADEHDSDIYVVAVPGSFVEPTRPVAWLAGAAGVEAADGLVAQAFVVDTSRSFYQDPRFGLSVLAEIASRALSPAVNDPGTAIDVIGRAVRVLATAAEASGVPQGEAQCPRVYVPTLQVDDFFDDVFGPIARDGATLVQVHMRLLKALAALARMGRYATPARRLAALALAHGEAALTLDEERATLRRLAAEVGR